MYKNQKRERANGVFCKTLYKKYLFLIFILPLDATFSEPLDNFAFYNLSKERIVLSDFLKKFSTKDILILNFTGSQCKPCKEQVPILLDLIKRTNIEADGKWKVFFWIVFVGDDFQTGKEYSNLLNLSNKAETLVDPLSTSYKRVKIVGLPTVLILNSKREIFFKTEGYNQSGMNDLKKFLSSWGK
ncbi:thioredoxin-like protein [Leptospira interrogans str. 2003000735]|uniref:TlpA-like protein n=6 Tax=Leptospira interrogans TaxID=173 RepID=Q8F6D9_LEPIN|nr:thioredoxin family protein [Leptospira interrogans]EMM97229.1 thioredoxin-like protein [Leptospira interrogans serovar Zanoni str. LT2156]EMY03252.1 thioredoxin-like protein [Leptospira interrogans str. 2002000626]EMY24098.1 thioredoxin-like protein [Leptospira interrogans serovar Australis str. 200703203]AAN48568.1 TlpA-like protein [Leptospira interrogans serovar Lai str. 56601]AER01901.1 TlpA-like protein [Leptospira interrogans serovar Lai str. IPAV]